MNHFYYKLIGKEIVPVEDIMEWANSVEGKNRHVADDHLPKHRISTIFLGINHSHGDGPPLLFETMIFSNREGEYQDRYSTWDEAEKGHQTALETIFPMNHPSHMKPLQRVSVFTAMKAVNKGFDAVKTGIKVSPWQPFISADRELTMQENLVDQIITTINEAT
jgi:hypothetical protein